MDELRKIMGLNGNYRVTKVEDRETQKVISKFIYVECISKKYKWPKCDKYTKRYKNNHMVEVLKYDLREDLLNIDEEFKMAYQLKELFLNITHHALYDDVKNQLINWIALVREQNIVEMNE